MTKREERVNKIRERFIASLDVLARKNEAELALLDDVDREAIGESLRRYEKDKKELWREYESKIKVKYACCDYDDHSKVLWIQHDKPSASVEKGIYVAVLPCGLYQEKYGKCPTCTGECMNWEVGQ